MNQDREMILKMLKDGKVTVEEAEALLQVLEESEQEERDSTDDAGTTIHVKGRAKTDDSHARDNEGESGFRFRVDEGFDLSFVGETVRKSLSGIKDTIREAMDGIRDIDFESEIKRAFGKEKGHAETFLDLDASGIEDLVVQGRAGEIGDVSIGASADHQIHVRGSVTGWANDVDTARRRAEALSLSGEGEGSLLSILAHSGDDEGIRRVRVDLAIEVPPVVGARIAVIGGDIRVSDISGNCELSTISGDVYGENIEGDVSAQSKSGDLRMHHVSGGLRCATLSGDIEVEGCGGTVDCDTKSGDVSIADAGGAVSGRSVSGDVEVELRDGAGFAPAGPVDLRSTSGSIEIEIPEPASYRLECKTTSGQIEFEGPIEIEKRSRTELVGVVGTGVQPVSLSTVSGDIEVS